MGDWKDRLGGAVGRPTSVLAGTGPVLAAASNGQRLAVSLQPDAPAFVGASSNFNASVGAFAAVPSGMIYDDPNHLGPVYVKTEGATALFRVTEF